MSIKWPAGWAGATIAELGEINPKHPTDTNRDQIISFVPMAGVSDTEGRIVETSDRPLSEVWKGYTHFAEGDVLFAKITPCMENGKSAIARDLRSGLGCGSTEFYVVRPNGAVLPDYLHPFLRRQSYRASARAAMTGAVGQLRVPKRFVENTIVPVPPLNEQRRIVAKIEALMARSGRAKEALDAIPALLDRYRQSVLAAAFRGDLTADWRTKHPDTEPASELLTRIREERQSRLAAMKGRRGKRRSVTKLSDSSAEPQVPGYELPNGWSLAWLADLSWHSSYGISSKCDYDFPGPPVLRIPNVANGQLLLDDLKRAGQDSFNDADAVDLGDLLIVRTNGSRNLIGRGVAITEPLPEPTYFASYLIRFRLLGGIDMARWLGTLWHSPQVRAQVYEHAATSAGQYNISLTELSGFAIPIPPLDELRAICQRVETALASTDAVVDQVREATGHALVFEQSILAKAFRGELVPQDPNDEPASALLARIKADRAGTGTRIARGRRRSDSHLAKGDTGSAVRTNSGAFD